MRCSFRSLAPSLVLAAFVVVLPGAGYHDEPKPSAYAPAASLVDQLEYFVEQLANDLADPQEYGEDQKKRVAQNASTVSVIALVLGRHDEENSVKPVAALVIAAASNLAGSTGDYDAAREALGRLQTALKGQGGDSVEWKPVADIVLLMQQVPIVNNRLRSGVNDDRRFNRSKERNAGYAATLAAIAQASKFDTSYCGGEEDEAMWARICGELRDASAAVGAAIRKNDQAAAKEALARVVKTCDACHESFR